MTYVLYCPECGKPMSVAGEHTRTSIACPHCGRICRPAATSRIGEVRTRPVSVTEWPAADPVGSNGDGTRSSRSRIVAGLLGIFFGYLGLHRLYLGYIGVGLIQLFLTLTAFYGPWPYPCLGSAVVVWGFAEGLLCLLGRLRDAQGRRLSI
jgi:hypothetical protein